MTASLYYDITIAQSQTFDDTTRRHTPPTAIIDLAFRFELLSLGQHLAVPDCADFKIAADVAIMAGYCWVSSLSQGSFDISTVRVTGASNSAPVALVDGSIAAANLDGSRGKHEISLHIKDAYTVADAVSSAQQVLRDALDLVVRETAAEARRLGPTIMERILQMPNMNPTRWKSPPMWLTDTCKSLA